MPKTDPPSIAETTCLRRPTAAERAGLPAIQASARTLFADTDHQEIFGVPLVTPSALERADAAGRLLVAASPGEVHGFGMWEGTGDGAHLHQLSVRPSCTGRGIGARLLDQILADAAASGFESMTLTTYDDVAWNRPFYERHGFRRAVPPLPGYVLDLLQGEGAAGFEVARRIAMVAPLRDMHAVRGGPTRV